MNWGVNIIFLFMILFSVAYAVDAVKGNVEFPLSFAAPERSSPGDWVKEEQIHVYGDKVVLDIKGARWARFSDTNSMDPVFDKESNTIEIVPETEEDIRVGDIISFKDGNKVIIHRVAEKGYDEKGIYFFTKGDNNKEKDKNKVRFSDVKGVVVGVIY